MKGVLSLEDLPGAISKPIPDLTVKNSIIAKMEKAIAKLGASGSLRENEWLYRLMAENILDVIIIMDLNLRHIYASPSITSLLGYSIKEILTMPLNKLLTPASMEKVVKTLDRELAGKNKHPEEHTYDSLTIELDEVCKNSSIITCETKVSFLRGSSGLPIAIIGVKRDITKRKLAKEGLSNANRQLLDIVDFLPDATFVIDREGKVLAWNRAIEEMTGVQQKDIIGKGNYAHSIPFYGEPRPVLADYISQKDQEIKYKYEVIKKEGDTLFAELYLPLLNGGKGAHLWVKASPLYDSEGNLAGAIESLRDISHYKQMDAELRKHQDQLEELVKERTTEIIRTNRQLDEEIAGRKYMEKEFARLERLNLIGKMAAVMGHEIRNPLTAVHGFLQMLRTKVGCT
ncbi:MAG: PAS domain S-box protein, partial [Desulfocucumaceae bacterium]